MFFGREEQIEQLEALWRKRVGSLVTCRGRRRIGKSTLIEAFAKKTKSRFIKIEGVKPKGRFSNENELAAFAMQLAAQTEADPTPPANWLNAFIRLNDKIRDDERTVVLLDGISWLGYYDGMFADTLRIACNSATGFCISTSSISPPRPRGISAAISVGKSSEYVVATARTKRNPSGGSNSCP